MFDVVVAQWELFLMYVCCTQGDGVRDTQAHSPHDVEPPTQLPSSQHDPYDLDDECLDNLLLELPVSELTAGARKPGKRPLDEGSEISNEEFMSAVGGPLPKRPHPEH